MSQWLPPSNELKRDDEGNVIGSDQRRTGLQFVSRGLWVEPPKRPLFICILDMLKNYEDVDWVGGFPGGRGHGFT